jgi:hypothetical protein
MRRTKFDNTSLTFIPVFALALVSSVAWPAPRVEQLAPPLTADEIASKLMQSEDQRHNTPSEYSVTRRYVLNNKRFSKSAEMIVKALYRKGEGKTFQVLGVTGSADVSKRVFDKLLDMEAEASKNEKIDPSRLTPDNYGFKLAGSDTLEGRRCYVLALTPKKKNKYLLEGKIWVDAQDFGVARFEGRPASSLGFWVGRPQIVQSFQRVNGYWLSAQNQSVSDTRLLGTTELKIEYSGYEFNIPETVRVAMRQQPHRAREFFSE